MNPPNKAQRHLATCRAAYRKWRAGTYCSDDLIDCVLAFADLDRRLTAGLDLPPDWQRGTRKGAR